MINCKQLEYKGILFTLYEALKKDQCLSQYKDTQMKPQTDEVSQQKVKPVKTLSLNSVDSLMNRQKLVYLEHLCV